VRSQAEPGTEEGHRDAQFTIARGRWLLAGLVLLFVGLGVRYSHKVLHDRSAFRRWQPLTAAVGVVEWREMSTSSICWICGCQRRKAERSWRTLWL